MGSFSFRAAVAWLVGAAALPGSSIAGAADRRPGDGVTVTIGGESSFLAALGELGDKFEDEAERRSLRAITDLHLGAVADDGPTRLRYGSIVELNAEESGLLQADKSFLFVEGGLGEFRLGRDDSAAVSLNYMASVLAVGTGGLDGEVIDSTDLVFLTPTNIDGFRIIYYSPEAGGMQLGFTYTMTEDDFGRGDDEVEDDRRNDVFDLTLNYNSILGGLNLFAAVSGVLGRLDAGPGSRSIEGVIGSALLAFPDFNLAGGLAYEDVGAVGRGFYTLGASTEVGPAGVSLNWGQCYACDDRENWNLVSGVEVGLLPGVSGALEVSYFDEDRDGDRNAGVIALWSVALDF
jgi:outer membrane protein OmpU